MSSRSRFVFCGALVAVALVCIRLGIWQTDRLRDRRRVNAVAAEALAAPPVDLDTVQGDGRNLAHRRVWATGRYDRRHEVVLRGMTLNDLPGVHVVTPLLLNDGRAAVLVKRGFAPAPDAVSARLDALDEPGEVTVTGIAIPVETRGDSGVPLMRRGATTWARLDLRALRGRSPYQLMAIYLLQTPGSSLPAAPRRLPAPLLDDGPHLSYAIQWFAFATTALVMAAIFALRSPATLSARPAPRSSS